MPTSSPASDRAALNDLKASYDSYSSGNANCSPDCARILYGRQGAVDTALSDYLDSELQCTYDVPGGNTFALIVFANEDACAKATRDIRTRINVQVMDVSGNSLNEE